MDGSGCVSETTKEEDEEEKACQKLLEEDSCSLLKHNDDDTPFPLEKIISGGQTGADLAGLKAAKELGLRTGGTAATGFLTTKGRNTSLRDTYGLSEIEQGVGNAYVRRSMKNVDDSTGTVAFRIMPSPGTDKTIGYCSTGKWKSPTGCGAFSYERSPHRHVLIVSKFDEHDKSSLLEFIRKNKITTLNVVGHRESCKVPADWSLRVQRFLVEVLHGALR